MNILTANVKLYSNLSYGIMARRIFSALKNMPRMVDEKIVGDPITWYYGEYGANYSTMIPTDLAKLLPFDMNKASMVMNQYIKKYKIDMVMMHDDLQRCKWFKTVSGAPVLYWVPWDNEDTTKSLGRQDLKHADEIVVVGKFAQRVMKDFGYDVEQVYDPIETDVYKPDPKARAEFKKKIGIPEDHKIITFIGRPGWRKRPYHTIKVASEVIKRNPKVHFLMHTDLNEPSWGGINPKEIFYANGLLEGNKLITSKNLRFDLGFPTDFMNQIYNATDVYFSPHGGEGMGLPLAEAMSAGVPIVATDYTTTPEFCGYSSGDLIGPRGCGARVGNVEGKPMFFNDRGVQRPYADLNHMVQQIEYLLEDDDLRKKMGEEGRKYAVENIDKKVVANKLGRIIHRMTDFTGAYID